MGKHDTSKATDTHQKLMNNAYKNDVYAKDFLEKLPIVERYAVVLGNLNYQVCNGGFGQWVDNGYCVAFPHVVEALKALGTENALATLKQVESMESILLPEVVDGSSTQTGCMGNYLKDTDEEDECQWCNGDGEEDSGEVDEDGEPIMETCTECGGSGVCEYEEEVNYPSSSDFWEISDEFLADCEVFLTKMVVGEYCEL